MVGKVKAQADNYGAFQNVSFLATRRGFTHRLPARLLGGRPRERSDMTHRGGQLLETRRALARPPRRRQYSLTKHLLGGEYFLSPQIAHTGALF